MANRAYLSMWTKKLDPSTMADQFERLLSTVPFSADRPRFSDLVIRAIDSAEAALVECDLRSQQLDAAELVALTRTHVHPDSAYEVQTHWDLWVFDLGLDLWQIVPQRLAITCHGEEYDGGVFAESGHFLADIGFEHLFTGHAGLLGSRPAGVPAPQDPAEAVFLSVMARPENLREYHQKTQENIQKLMGWVSAMEQVVPVARYRLWSEGEQNLEARLDEILAVR